MGRRSRHCAGAERRRFESMPQSALEYVEPDHQLPAREIGALLPRLLEQQAASAPQPDRKLRTQMELEIGIAVEDDAFRKGSAMRVSAVTTSDARSSADPNGIQHPLNCGDAVFLMILAATTGPAV